MRLCCFALEPITPNPCRCVHPQLPPMHHPTPPPPPTKGGPGAHTAPQPRRLLESKNRSRGVKNAANTAGLRRVRGGYARGCARTSARARVCLRARACVCVRARACVRTGAGTRVCVRVRACVCARALLPRRERAPPRGGPATGGVAVAMETAPRGRGGRRGRRRPQRRRRRRSLLRAALRSRAPPAPGPRCAAERNGGGRG